MRRGERKNVDKDLQFGRLPSIGNGKSVINYLAVLNITLKKMILEATGMSRSPVTDGWQ